MATLRKETLETLAFVRYMVGLAQEQAEKPDPFCAMALLTIHDAVELFLIQAREQPGVTMPTNKDQAFEENCPRAFGIYFEDISLLDLVHNARAKRHLVEAEKLHNLANDSDALTQIAIAFAILMDRFNWDSDATPQHHKHRFSSDASISAHYNMNRMGSLSRSVDAGSILRAMATEVDDVYKEIDALGTVVAVLLLKLDYARYLKFMKLVPYVAGYIDRNAENGTEYQAFPGDGFAAKAEDYQFCLNFVIEVAIAVEGILAIS